MQEDDDDDDDDEFSREREERERERKRGPPWCHKKLSKRGENKEKKEKRACWKGAFGLRTAIEIRKLKKIHHPRRGGVYSVVYFE